MSIALPGYQSYMLRVHRSEAIRMLLQASMCQQRIYANNGNYDTNQCQSGSESKQYQLSYTPLDTQGGAFIAMAVPNGTQIADPCGNLTLDQNGTRDISSLDISSTKCWNGR